MEIYIRYTSETLLGITDPVEKFFAARAVAQGYIVEDSPMITLDRPKRNKQDKRSTVPDFLVRRDEIDPGIYVELTIKNLCSRKSGQLAVMREAGLAHRYAQLTAEDIELAAEVDVYNYLLDKIACREAAEHDPGVIV